MSRGGGGGGGCHVLYYCEQANILIMWRGSFMYMCNGWMSTVTTCHHTHINCLLSLGGCQTVT